MESRENAGGPDAVVRARERFLLIRDAMMPLKASPHPYQMRIVVKERRCKYCGNGSLRKGFEWQIKGIGGGFVTQ